MNYIFEVISRRKTIIKAISVCLAIMFFVPMITVSCGTQETNVPMSRLMSRMGHMDVELSPGYPVVIVFFILPIIYFILCMYLKNNKLLDFIICICSIVELIAIGIGYNYLKEFLMENYIECERTIVYWIYQFLLVGIAVFSGGGLALKIPTTANKMDYSKLSKFAPKTMNPSGKWTCEKCGSVIDNKYSFCGKCGTQKPEPIEEEKLPEDEISYCMKCGSEMHSDYMYCMNCGNPRPNNNLIDKRIVIDKVNTVKNKMNPKYRIVIPTIIVIIALLIFNGRFESPERVVRKLAVAIANMDINTMKECYELSKEDESGLYLANEVAINMFGMDLNGMSNIASALNDVNGTSVSYTCTNMESTYYNAVMKPKLIQLDIINKFLANRVIVTADVYTNGQFQGQGYLLLSKNGLTGWKVSLNQIAYKDMKLLTAYMY